MLDARSWLASCVSYNRAGSDGDRDSRSLRSAGDVIP